MQAKDTHILVVDDDRMQRSAISRLLTHQGYTASAQEDVPSALAHIVQQRTDVILVDLELEASSGLELVHRVRELHGESLPCIVMTAFGSPQRSVESLRAGAFWYLQKPIDDFSVLERLLRAAVRQRGAAEREPSGGPGRCPMIIGGSRPLLDVLAQARKVASTRASVLLGGESGTGKEQLARFIHAFSDRAERPFVPIGCGSIPSGLLESELFGHVRGAFTHAGESREGRFSRADGGTIFLDEIGELSLPLQVRLLRVLQDGSFEPVGSSQSQQVDVRTIAATNLDLERAVREGRFRADLYYRLSVVPIQLPALRQRREDIPLLARHFLQLAVHRLRAPRVSISAAALDRLGAYDWPGNIRELENLILRLVALSDGAQIDVAQLPAALQNPSPRRGGAGPAHPGPALPEEGLQFSQVVRRFESEIIRRALAHTGGNKARAAQMLGINRTTLLEMIKRRGLEPGESDR